LRVKVIYKNHLLETVNVSDYDLDVYCFELSDKLVKLLGVIEGLLDIKTLKENDAYQKIRHVLLDTAGSIKRLPDNLMLEPGQKIVWEDECNDIENNDISEIKEDIFLESKPKVTLNLIQRMFGKVGD
jgi:hypothetical protein